MANAEGTPAPNVEMVTVTINGKELQVPRTCTLLDACKKVDTYVPTLCYHPRLKPAGRCNCCLVEVMLKDATEPTFELACSTKVQDGMIISTTTPELLAEQAAALSELEGKQLKRLEVAGKEPNNEFEALCKQFAHHHEDHSSVSISRNMALCVECGRCVRACKDLQGINILTHSSDPNAPSPIETQGGLPLDQTDCIACGQCAVFCPTGAIEEKSDLEKVEEVIKKGEKAVVLQFAPSTRVALPEELGLEPGALPTNKVVGLFKAVGFEYVVDTQFSADLTIMEEGSELLDRVSKGGVLPMFTSCCPGWVNMVEKLYPQFIPNLSSAKSPQQMLGPIVKSYFAKKMGLDPKKIFHVSLMPCTAKKQEMLRPTMDRDGMRDVDAVLVTREMGRLLRKHGFMNKEKLDSVVAAEPDSPVGMSTGAATIFGVTGGVMEAALRTVYELKTGKTLPQIVFQDVRGLAETKEAVVDVGGLKVSVAVVNSGKSIRDFLDRMVKDNKQYHFVEFMACPAGCIGGGGQPRSGDGDILTKRMQAVYKLDELASVRKSHENPEIKLIYKDFLGKPLGKLSHHMLHTSYASHARKERPSLRKRPKRQIGTAPTGGIDAAALETKAATEIGGLLILYATQTGTAFAAAKTLAEETKARGHKVRLIRMNRYDPPMIKDEENVLVVAATFGDGELTDDAQSMWSYLSDPAHTSEHLAKTKFAVFGLGNSSYCNTFCVAATLLHDKFVELGAIPLTSPGLGDEIAADKYETALMPWMQSLWDALPENPEAVEASLSAAAAAPPTVPYIVNLEPETAERGRQIQKDPIPEGAAPVMLKTNKRITPEGYTREVRFLEFTGVPQYHTCDHFVLYPQNNPGLVRVLLEEDLKLDPQAIITAIDPTEGSEALPLKTPLTVKQLFRIYLDVFGRVQRSFVRKLAKHARDPQERKRLEWLGCFDGKEDFRSLFDSGATYADVLREFSSARPPLGALVDMINFIQPRFYSIASSPENTPGVVQLIIVLDRFVTARGPKTGLCSSYVEHEQEGSLVPASRVEGLLRVPADPLAPMILVGLGTGMAPMRGLLLHRRWLKGKLGRKLGPAVFYYGCRYPDKDFLLEEELMAFMKEGVLTELVPVFSHVTEPKLRFATDEFKENPGTLWKYLQMPNVYYMFCGPAFGVPEQIEKVITKIMVDKGSMTTEKASGIIADMKKNKRYCVEAFGGENLNPLD